MGVFLLALSFLGIVGTARSNQILLSMVCHSDCLLYARLLILELTPRLHTVHRLYGSALYHPIQRGLGRHCLAGIETETPAG